MVGGFGECVWGQGVDRKCHLDGNACHCCVCGRTWLASSKTVDDGQKLREMVWMYRERGKCKKQMRKRENGPKVLGIAMSTKTG